MKEIRSSVHDKGRKLEFTVPVKEVADALDLSTDEFLAAVHEDKVG